MEAERRPIISSTPLGNTAWLPARGRTNFTRFGEVTRAQINRSNLDTLVTLRQTQVSATEPPHRVSTLIIGSENTASFGPVAAWNESIVGRVGKGLHLVNPLEIEVSDRDGDGVFVVSDFLTTVYGAGDTPTKAIENYRRNLAETFRDLTENAAELGPKLLEELSTLRAIIRTK